MRSIALSAVVVDRDLRIRLVTASAAQVLGIEEAAMGIRLADVPALTAQIDLIEDVRDVLAHGVTIERLVLCASGECVTRRCQPYLSQRPSAGGAVITLAKRDGRSIHDGSRPATEEVLSRLTARQREIMTLVLAGHPSKKIAAELGISSRTVENHRASIMHRTGCRSLPELTRFALRATPQALWS